MRWSQRVSIYLLALTLVGLGIAAVTPTVQGSSGYASSSVKTRDGMEASPPTSENEQATIRNSSNAADLSADDVYVIEHDGWGTALVECTLADDSKRVIPFWCGEVQVQEFLAYTVKLREVRRRYNSPDCMVPFRAQLFRSTERRLLNKAEATLFFKYLKMDLNSERNPAEFEPFPVSREEFESMFGRG